MQKTFTLSHGGKSDVQLHSAAAGHKKAQRAANSQSVHSSFVRARPTAIDLQVGRYAGDRDAIASASRYEILLLIERIHIR